VRAETTAEKHFEKLEPELKDRILDAAVQEFFLNGYRSASMNRLVKLAGISKGAIFKYFGTKAGVFKYVYSEALTEVKNSLRKVRDETRGEPFFVRLEQVIRSWLDLTTRKPMYAAIYYRVVYTGDSPHSREMLGEIRDVSHRFLRSLIEDGIDRGDLRPNLDTDRASFVLQSVLDRFFQVHHLEMIPHLLKWDRQGNPTLEAWIEEIITIFRNGM